MILVTGASGLLGSHLIKELLKQGKRVKALYKNSSPLGELEGAVWIKGDILDIVWLQEVMEDVEEVYHCAAAVSFNPKKKELLYKVNVEGTANVVNTCLSKNVKKMLHVSSIATLAKTQTQHLITEQISSVEEISNNIYGKTKCLGEMEVWRGIGEGLNAVIINPSIILGAGDWNKGSTELFQTIYKEFPWYTEGVSGFVDVRDVVQAMITLMQSDVQAERFIINAENIAFKQIFNFIADNFGKKPPHKKVTPFLAEMVWRLEYIKSKITGKDPLLTKDTARTAQEKRFYDNTRLKSYFPQFKYTPIQTTIYDICKTLKQQYKLN